jgi:hypothetical protein
VGANRPLNFRATTACPNRDVGRPDSQWLLNVDTRGRLEHLKCANSGRKRVKIAQWATGRVDSRRPEPLGSDRPKKRKGRTFEPDCWSSAALSLSGQPDSYNHNEPNERGDNAGRDADQRPDQQDLFGENKQRQCGDPDEVHDPENEEQRHQQCAAAETIGPVGETQACCACPARLPKPHQKRHRGTAFLQTYSLEWRRLIEAGRDQESAADALIAKCEVDFGDRARPHKQPLS